MEHQASRRGPEAIVDYPAIRATYHMLRLGVAAGWMVATFLASVAWQWGGGKLLAVLAVGVAGHALWRRRRPDRSPLEALILDATVASASVLLGGIPAESILAVFAFVITGAFLLLDVRRALLLVGYLPFAAAVVFLFAGTPALPGPRGRLMGLLIGILGIAAIAILFTAAAERVQEARARQRAALEAERKAGQMKNEFVSMVSHELRTPLTSIAGFADTLRSSWKDIGPEEIDEFLGIINEQAEHLFQLVEDILVIPRLEAGRVHLEPSLFELRPVAYRIADLLFPTGGGKEASVSIPGGVMVWADQTRVKEVLRNLLENARKYGGDQVVVEGSPMGDKYLAVVSDNGPGVPEEDRERIFDHFEQLTKGDSRKESGIGLGLPIARKLVDAMGGELWYEPRFPTGSRFCFTIDLQPPSPDEEPSSPGDARPDQAASYVPS